jgi:hypothetical protein
VNEIDQQQVTNRRGSARYAIAAVLLALTTIAATYCLLRWAPSPAITTLVVVSMLLIALATLGFFGSRRGQAAPFVVVALLLPYLLVAAAFYGGAQRVANEIDTFFSDAEGDAEPSFDEELEATEPEDFSDTEDTFEGEGAGDLPIDGPCLNVSQFAEVEVGMPQAEVDELLSFPGTPSGGGAGAFTQAYPDCAGPDQTFYITFSIDPPNEVAEMRHQ